MINWLVGLAVGFGLGALIGGAAGWYYWPPRPALARQEAFGCVTYRAGAPCACEVDACPSRYGEACYRVTCREDPT